MSARVNVVNRTVLALLGLHLLAAGGLGPAHSFGAFGTGQCPVLPQPRRDYARDQGWFWWAVAGVRLLLALLGLRWLLAQLRTDRVGRLDLTTDDRGRSAHAVSGRPGASGAQFDVDQEVRVVERLSRVGDDAVLDGLPDLGDVGVLHQVDAADMPGRTDANGREAPSPPARTKKFAS